MTIVDDMAMFAVRPGPTARKTTMGVEPWKHSSRSHKGAPQPMADQSRGNRGEHLAQREGAGAGDVDVDLLIVGGLADRQLVQRHSLLIDALGVAEVTAANDVVDEAPPCGESSKSREARSNRRQQALSSEMAVGALDRAVLVAHAGIVAGRRPCRESRRRTVSYRFVKSSSASAPRLRKAAERLWLRCCSGTPPSDHRAFCKPLRQRDEAFAARAPHGHDRSRKRATEVISRQIEKLAGDGDARIVRFGEVRQSHPTRRMLLAKDHLPSRAVHRPPSPDAPLEGPPCSGAQVRMPAADPEDSDRSQSGSGLEHGHDLTVPDIGKGSARRRSRRALFWLGSRGSVSKPVGSGRAKSGFGADNGRRKSRDASS